MFFLSFQTEEIFDRRVEKLPLSRGRARQFKTRSSIETYSVVCTGLDFVWCGRADPVPIFGSTMQRPETVARFRFAGLS